MEYICNTRQLSVATTRSFIKEALFQGWRSCCTHIHMEERRLHYLAASIGLTWLQEPVVHSHDMNMEKEQQVTSVHGTSRD